MIFLHYYSVWSPVLVVLSILTMTIGNITAVSQSNIKRFLAYSSIAQAGYILMGLAVFSMLGRASVLIYLLAYLLTNLGAFAVVLFVGGETGSDSLDAYAGLSQRSPAAAAMLTVFLLSLAGLPPFAGFIAKYYVFAAAIQANFITLTIVAVMNSVVAAYYYFRIIRVMYLVPCEKAQPAFGKTPFASKLAIVLMALGVLGMGLFPGFFIKLILG
jgi:NADH:ubiquinone oxidoreductase subunit 2 (subunit N)